MKTLVDIALEREWLEKSSQRYWKHRKVLLYKDNPENRRLNRVGQPYTRGKDDPDDLENGNVEEYARYFVNRPSAGTVKRIDDASRFGRNYTGYEGASRAAIIKLFEERSGQIEAAFNVYLPVIEVVSRYDPKLRRRIVEFILVKNPDGTFRMQKYPVDLVWGDDNDGLQHTGRRHFIEQRDYIHPSALVDSIIDTMLEFSQPNSNSTFEIHGDRLTFVSSNGNRVVLKIEVNRDSKNRRLYRLYLLTSYNDLIEAKDKKIQWDSLNSKLRQKVWEKYKNRSDR